MRRHCHCQPEKAAGCWRRGCRPPQAPGVLLLHLLVEALQGLCPLLQLALPLLQWHRGACVAHCLGLFLQLGASFCRHTGSGSPLGANGWCLHTHQQHEASACWFQRCRALCLLLELVPLPLQAHREAALGRVWLTACWLQRCRASACCVSWRSCLCLQRVAGG